MYSYKIDIAGKVFLVIIQPILVLQKQPQIIYLGMCIAVF